MKKEVCIIDGFIMYPNDEEVCIADGVGEHRYVADYLSNLIKIKLTTPKLLKAGSRFLPNGSMGVTNKTAYKKYHASAWPCNVHLQASS